MINRNRQVKCRICDNSEQNESYLVQEMMFGCGEQFTYVHCSKCNCLQLSEIPLDMSKYYPRSYYSFATEPQIKYKNAIIGSIRKIVDYHTVFPASLFGTIISTIGPNKKLTALANIALTKNSRILDVGCGTGWRLYALKEIGFQNVLGIDPYLDSDIKYQNGLRILKKSTQDIHGQWDLIMYHHSFEHIADPRQELKSVFQLLSRNGTCMLRMPTVSSHAWERYREHWYQIDAPRHYFLHSIESVELLAGETGFSLHDVVFDSTVDQFRGSELYMRGIPLIPRDQADRIQSKSVLSKSRIRNWEKETKKLNRDKSGDQAAFYLVKNH